MKKAILVWRSSALGDFILSAPALRELRNNYPDHKIIFLTITAADKSQREKVLKYTEENDRFPWITLARPHLIDEVIQVDNIYSIRNVLNIKRSLRRHHFDFSILMIDPGSPWLGRIKKWILVFLLTGNTSILGWRLKGSNKGNVAKLNERGLLGHHVHGPMHFLKEGSAKLVYPNDSEILFDLRPSDKSIVWARNFISNNNLEKKRLIAIAPGSVQPHKSWPLEQYNRLIDDLKNIENVFFLIIGAKGDAKKADVLINAAPHNSLSLAGITNIDQSAAILNKVELLIGNDGGAVHLADAMGAKVVSIIPGLEYPDSIEPWNNKELSVRHQVDCAPCYSFTKCPLGHNRCMRELPYHLVFEKVVNALDYVHINK